MTFKKVDWRNLEYPKKNTLAELNIIENDRKIERLLFNDANGLEKAKTILRKHGIGEISEEDVKKETEKIRKELDSINKKQKGFLDKDWEW